MTSVSGDNSHFLENQGAATVPSPWQGLFLCCPAVSSLRGHLTSAILKAGSGLNPNCFPRGKGQESPVFEYTLSCMPLYFGSDLTTSRCGFCSCHVVMGLKMSRQQSPPYSGSHGSSQ